MDDQPHHWVATQPGDLDVFRFEAFDVPAPEEGEVTIDVRAAGVNPADYKHILSGDFTDPRPIGFEASGIIREMGPRTEIASGGGAAGDEVIAFRLQGGYSTRITVPAKDVFAKPEALDHPAGANLLLAGTTGAEMLHITQASAGDAIVLHGASGAVGVSVLQQARQAGVRVVGTASRDRFATVERFGATPVVYGPGLEDRLRELCPDGYAAALDAVGTDEAVDVSLALVPDPERIVTIAAFGRVEETGIQAIGGAMPASAAFRDEVRAHLIALAAAGDLVVPVARTYPLDEAREALAFLREGHPGGKLALLA